MEEIFQIIITTVIIIAATAFSQLGKKKRTKQETYVPIDEGNTEDISSDTLHKISHTPKQSQGFKSAQTKTKKAATIDQNSTQTANNTPNNDSNEATQEVFDLRKAVVYSEILSPKFKEEEY